MKKNFDKNAQRLIRHARIRRKISGTSLRPRLSVYRSTNEIFCQIIDDENMTTLVSVSTKEKELSSKLSGKTKSEQAKIVGEILATRALEKNIENVVFDRGGYIYAGRIKQVAEGARQSGLKF